MLQLRIDTLNKLITQINSTTDLNQLLTMGGQLQKKLFCSLLSLRARCTNAT